MVMRNPFWRLKSLPWVILLQAAGLVVLLATVADLLLAQVFGVVARGLPGALLPLLQLVMLVLPVAAGFGMGALGLLVLERLFRQIHLDTAVLWALVPCLVLVLFLKRFLPVPTFLVTVGYAQLVGSILGIFVTGKRHWRRW
jgi:hypothetical protein